MPNALDLITLAEFKLSFPKPTTGRDKALDLFITAASRAIENDLDRRARYRGPAEVEGADNILASRTIQNETVSGGTITQPAGTRTLILTVFDADFTITGGTVTVTGTVGGLPATEVFDLAKGLHQHGVKFFTAISTVEVATLQGNGAGDTYKLGASTGYVEYHSLDPDDPTCFQPLEWPVRTVFEVNEDASRTFGATTRLVSGTDYQLVSADSKRCDRSSLLRLSSSLQTVWAGGWRANKIVLASGYTAAGVPQDLRDVCRRLTQLIDDEVSKGRLGMSSMSDALGNFTRFAAAGITKEMRSLLEPYRRRSYGFETGERDFELEAA